MRARRMTYLHAAVLTAVAAVVSALLATPDPAFARSLEVPEGEEAAIDACEKELCTMILEKKPGGRDLACDLQKTWAKSSLEGGKSKGIGWGFGDARCHVDLNLSRADVIAALTRPKHTVRIPTHHVKCVVIRQDVEQPVKIRVAPKLKFKGGKADKVWINLEEIDGPADVRTTVWTAANLEDTLGLFHRPLVRSINKFIHRKCEKKWGENGTEIKAERKKKKEKKKKSRNKDEAKAAAKKIEAAKAGAAP